VDGDIQITLFNSFGKSVKVFADFERAGVYSKSFEVSALPIGMYYLEMEFSGEKLRRKVMIFR
jgi:hypothetical protein